MKTFYVSVPVVMRLSLYVEAEDEHEAKEKVLSGDISIDVTDRGNQFDGIDWEWEMHEKVVQGNVYYGITNEMEITEEEL